MAKQSPIIRFTQDRARPAARTVPHRLYSIFPREKFRLTYDELADWINEDTAVYDYVLDTNFFTAHEVPERVWDALMKNRITITGRVWQELEPWRNNPFYNRDRVRSFTEAFSGHNEDIVFFDKEPWGVPCGVFRDWYTSLLVRRKQEAVFLIADFEQTHGRPPTEAEMNTLFQRGFTERDTTLFRKGFREITENGNIFTDEQLVATAAVIAFVGGRSVTILTRDHDVLEQFYKVTDLLTCDYQAALFADQFAHDPGGFRVVAMPVDEITDHYFDAANGLLVAKPLAADEFISWLLPPKWEPVQMTCVLLTGGADNLAATPLPYIGETGMSRLVEAKGRSRGLNTDVLDGRNCHITGYPTSIPSPREYAIVAEDRAITDQNGLLYSRMDLAHVVYHFEQSMFMPVQWPLSKTLAGLTRNVDIESWIQLAYDSMQRESDAADRGKG